MAGRMAADRMARGRGCPDQILALDTAGRHALAEARRHGKTALAHRTRLPRPEQEIGLDHYEGRGWRGFHHHAALSIAAYGFLVAERSPIPPSAPLIRALRHQIPPQEKDFRPRGAAPT